MFNVEEELALFLRSALTTKFGSYYLGDIKPQNIPGDYLPALCIWGSQTDLRSRELSTARDKYTFTLNIKAVVNAYSYAQEDEPKNATDSNIIEVQAQKKLRNLMEERDSNMKPIDASVLGALRNNVTGVDYLFSNEISIRYYEENIAGTQYLISTLTMQNVTRYNTR